VTEHLRTNCAVIERFLPVRLRVGAEKAPVVRIDMRINGSE
jgi:RNA 3'-terminal phosphate cyclase